MSENPFVLYSLFLLAFICSLCYHHKHAKEKHYITCCVDKTPSQILSRLYSTYFWEQSSAPLPCVCFLRSRAESLIAEDIILQFQNWLAKTYFSDNACVPRFPDWREQRAIRKRFNFGGICEEYYLSSALSDFLQHYSSLDLYAYDPSSRSEVLSETGVVHHKLLCTSEYIVAICLNYTIPDWLADTIPQS